MRQILLLTAYITLVNCLPQATSLPKYTKLSEEQVRHLQNRGFGPTIASRPFRATAAYEEDDDEGYEEDSDTDATVSATQVRRPSYIDDNYPIALQNVIPVAQPRPQARPQQQAIPRRPSGAPQQFRQQLIEDTKEKPKEEEEEEPDRLSLLLPQSKFECSGKNGYYADEELGCEVFHYCQDNAKHSWICPEGFTFHQVHLICMPPGADNICDKSSQYHFVNEYLYKPVNLEEHQNKPNITLRYSERFYPDQYYGRNYDEEEDVQPQRKQPIRVGLQQAPGPQAPVLAVVRRPLQFTPSSFRPEPTVGQVFRSPEEVNISLQQRRPPAQYITPRYHRQDDGYSK